MHTRTLALAALLTATLTADATADTLTVPTDAYPTIQSAIDAATGEDKIVVRPGLYREALVIPAGKDGLELAASRKAILGPPPVDVESPDPGFVIPLLDIESNDVTVRGLDIRHSAAQAIVAGPPPGVLGSSNLAGITLDRVTVINADDEAMVLDVDDALVSSCFVRGCNGGIRINGERGRVLKTTVEQDGDGGVTISGDDAVVENCRMELIDDSAAIAVDGFGARISRNRMEVLDDLGIESSGSSSETPNLIERNTVRYVGDGGIESSGDGATVVRNVVECVENAGIQLSGDGAVIDGNRISRTNDDAQGMQVNGDDNVITKNRIMDTCDDGITVSGDRNEVSSNTVTRGGSERERGIEISGDDNLVTSNRVSQCEESGIEIRGDRNELVKNRVSGCTDNGILIKQGSDNVLDGNSATGNRGDGLENLAIDTVLEGNRSTGNLQDLANGSDKGVQWIDQGGNVFKTGSLTAPPIDG